jgi:hypothetical protein
LGCGNGNGFYVDSAGIYVYCVQSGSFGYNFIRHTIANASTNAGRVTNAAQLSSFAFLNNSFYVYDNTSSVTFTLFNIPTSTLIPSVYYSYAANYHPIEQTSRSYSSNIVITGASNLTSFYITNNIAYLCDARVGTIYSYNLSTGVQTTVFSIVNSILPGDIKILAGSSAGYIDAQGTSARFNYPYGLTVYTNSNILVADTVNSNIRMINVNFNDANVSSVTTVTALTSFTLAYPQSISLYSNSLYTLCWNSAGLSQIVSVPFTSYPSTTFTFTTNTAVTEASTYISLPYPNMYTVSQYAGPPFVFPSGVHAPLVVDPVSGNMYVFDSGNSYIRMVTPAGIVSTIAGNGISARVNNPIGSLASFNSTTATQLAITSTGTMLFVPDSDVFRVVDLRPGNNYAVTSSISYFGTVTGMVVNSTNTILYLSDPTNGGWYLAGAYIGNPESSQSWTMTRFVGGLPLTNLCIAGDYIYSIYPGTPNILRISAIDYSYSVIAGATRGTMDGIGAVAQFENPKYITLSDDKNFLYVVDGYGNSTNIRRIELISGNFTVITPTGQNANPLPLTYSVSIMGIAYDPVQQCIFYTSSGNSPTLGSDVNEIMKLTFNPYSRFNPSPPQNVQLRNATGRTLTVAVSGATVTNPTLYSIPGNVDQQTLYPTGANTYTLG